MATTNTILELGSAYVKFGIVIDHIIFLQISYETLTYM
jgi:hypothetical protein